jgi:cytoskeletal protein RodZ
LPIKVTINTSQRSKEEMQISEVSKVLGIDESVIEVNPSEDSPLPPSPSPSEDTLTFLWIVITSISIALILVICIFIYYIRKSRNKSPPISDSSREENTNSNVVLKKQTHIKSRNESPRMSSRPSHFEGTSQSLKEKNKKKYSSIQMENRV